MIPSAAEYNPNGVMAAENRICPLVSSSNCGRRVASTHNKDGHRHQNLLPDRVDSAWLGITGVSRKPRVRVVEPHEASVAVNEPHGEQSGDDGQELIEEWDELRNEETDNPHETDHAHPCEPGAGAAGSEQRRVSQPGHVEVFCANVGTQNTRHHDRHEGKSVGDDGDSVGRHCQRG